MLKIKTMASLFCCIRKNTKHTKKDLKSQGSHQETPACATQNPLKTLDNEEEWRRDISCKISQISDWVRDFENDNSTPATADHHAHSTQPLALVKNKSFEQIIKSTSVSSSSSSSFSSPFPIANNEV